jgi:hypothetical protein
MMSSPKIRGSGKAKSAYSAMPTSPRIGQHDRSRRLTHVKPTFVLSQRHSHNVRGPLMSCRRATAAK